MFQLAELFAATVGEAMETPVAAVAADTPLRDALSRMDAAGVSRLLVTDSRDRPVGWLCDGALRRQVLSRDGPGGTAGSAMVGPAHLARAGERRVRALARARGAPGAALAVVDVRGGVVGLIDAAAPCPEDWLFDVEPGALATSRRAQVRAVERLLESGMDAAHVAQALGHWNRAVHEGAAAGARARMDREGLGGPPCAHALLAMGSVGRGECLLGPDQDNALVYADPPPGDEARVDRWFRCFAGYVNEALEQAGFPRCRGGVMAVSAEWRAPLGRWARQVADWTRQPDGRPLRLCDIFFDLYPVHGDPALAATLRARVEDAAAHPHFLRALYRVDEAHGVALDLFGRLRTDPLPGPGHGQVALKLTGLLPLVGAVRILALSRRLAVTGTLARLDALRAGGAVETDEHEALCDAFTRIAAALLRRQLEDAHAGRDPAGHVAPDSLGRLERARLVDALNAVRRFRDGLRSWLQGEPVFRISPAGP